MQILLNNQGKEFRLHCMFSISYNYSPFLLIWHCQCFYDLCIIKMSLWYLSWHKDTDIVEDNYISKCGDRNQQKLITNTDKLNEQFLITLEYSFWEIYHGRWRNRDQLTYNITATTEGTHEVCSIVDHS